MAGPLDQPVLTTARLRLRPFEARDAKPLHGFFTDAKAMRYFDDLHETFEQTCAFVASTIRAPLAVSADFIIELDGEVIGKAGMWSKPEIGVFILSQHQRQGYAREALEAIIPWLFKTYDLDCLLADIDPQNFASLQLFESLGFRVARHRKATIRIAGVWCDSVDLELTNADWQARLTVE